MQRETVASGHWFAGLPTSFQQALCGSARVVTLRAGELLFQWGDDNSGLYTMLEGTIRFGAVNLDNVIATNLASALFVMMLRLHVRQVPEPRSMFSLLHDRMTSRAVVAMLKERSKGWTLNEMAEAAITSRVTLVRSFRSARIGADGLSDRAETRSSEAPLIGNQRIDWRGSCYRRVQIGRSVQQRLSAAIRP
ncbi:MAG: hypothetical protein WAU74_14745 [Pseudolabrys sp.]